MAVSKNQPSTHSRRANLRDWLLAVLLGLAGTAQFHLPQLVSRFDMFPGDRGDARLVTFLLEHWYQVLRGNNSWLSPPMFYPVKGTIGYADLVIGYAVPYSLLRALGLDMLYATEVAIIFISFANYFVCYILLRKILNLNTLASCAGAMFFAFNSPKLVQLGHLQLQPVTFLPLAIIFVVLFARHAQSNSRVKAFVFLSLAALSLDLQLVTGFYAGWFFVFWSCLFLLVIAILPATRAYVWSLLKKSWQAVAAATILFVVGLTPFLIAYLPVLRGTGGRPYAEVQALIPVPWSLLVMGERNFLWGGLAEAIKHSYPLHPELQIGIGFIPSLAWIGLLLYAVWLIRKGRVSRAAKPGGWTFIVPLILATTLVYLIGMRYWNDFSPWQFAYHFPGATGIRAVARYAIVLALPMSIAFSFGLDRLLNRLDSRTMRNAVYSIAVIAVVTFGLVEQFAVGQNFNGFSIKTENQYLRRLASKLPDNCTAFYAGVDTDQVRNDFEYQIDTILVALMRDVPTLNGYSGQVPPDWPLWEVRAPNYQQRVDDWVNLKRIPGKICRLDIKDPHR